tara:strand:- start:230 stop:448 length:219 start_codon:yes stop_codon:yes gene_type:complete
VYRCLPYKNVFDEDVEGRRRFYEKAKEGKKSQPGDIFMLEFINPCRLICILVNFPIFTEGTSGGYRYESTVE